MYDIKNISIYNALQSASKGLPSNLSTQSGTDFQITPLTSSPTPSLGRGVSALAYPSLGTQTVLALLQTQDVGQMTAYGHGGGTHLGGLKIISGLEAEEVTDSLEAQLLNQRKKMSKRINPTEISLNAKENGDVEQSNHDQGVRDNKKKNQNLSN